MASRFHRTDHTEPSRTKNSYQGWHHEMALEGAWRLLEAMENGDYGDEGLPDLYSYIIVFRAVRHHQNDLD